MCLRYRDGRYDSLEELHVFVLAHVLQRPLIVVAESFVSDFNGEALTPSYFSGIYLPLELSPDICCRIPLLLLYSQSHFSPLVALNNREIQKLGKSAEIFGL